MQPAKQFDLCPWNKLNALPHMGWQHAGWFASYVVNAKNILEWGCGGSTLWMAMMCPDGVTCIEHSREWFNKVFDAAIQMTGILWSVPRMYFHPQASYVQNDAVRYSTPYDLIFIDGIERPVCLAASYDLLAPGGVVFLHDSQRAEYTKAKRQLLEREGMTQIFHTEARGKERAFQIGIESRDEIAKQHVCNDWQDESWVNPRAGMWAAQKHE